MFSNMPPVTKALLIANALVFLLQQVLGDAVFQDHFDRPDWYNAFDHDPEEAVRVRVSLLRELAETVEPLVAAHLPFPSVGRVAVDGGVFRWVPVIWDY